MNSVVDQILNPSTVTVVSMSKLNQSADHQKKLRESASPTTGIYYCIPSVNGGWEPFVYRFDDIPETDHTDLWENHVAPVLAYRWAKKLGRKVPDLELDLTMLAYAVPRGRITGPPWKVLHGKDMPAGISKNSIQRSFALPPTVTWEPDEHERCQADDRDSFRKIMKLKETWPAV